jgi:hypothetical protein
LCYWKEQAIDKITIGEDRFHAFDSQGRPFSPRQNVDFIFLLFYYFSSLFLSTAFMQLMMKQKINSLK